MLSQCDKPLAQAIILKYLSALSFKKNICGAAYIFTLTLHSALHHT